MERETTRAAWKLPISSTEQYEKVVAAYFVIPQSFDFCTYSGYSDMSLA